MANSKKQPKNLVRSGGPQKNHGSKQTAAATRAKQLEAKRAAERQVIIDTKEAAAVKRAAEFAAKKTDGNGAPARKSQTKRPASQRINKALQVKTVEASTRGLQRLTPQINGVAAATKQRQLQPA